MCPMSLPGVATGMRWVTASLYAWGEPQAKEYSPTIGLKILDFGPTYFGLRSYTVEKKTNL